MSDPAFEYNAVEDAIAFLSGLTPAKRHAIVRAIGFDEESLAVMAWLIAQPDCDIATAAMLFWRLRSLQDSQQDTQPTPRHGKQRALILNEIVTRVESGAYTANELAWDGYEAWQRVALIDARQIDGLTGYSGAAPEALFGPFEGAALEPLSLLFLDFDSADDDIFDGMWRYGPTYYVDLADGLIGKPTEAWMQAFSDLANAHPLDFYEWMVKQPECPACVAGRIFWGFSNPFYSVQEIAEGMLSGEFSRDESISTITYIIDRWRAGGYTGTTPNYRFYTAGTEHVEMLKRYPGKADPLDIPQSLLFSEGIEPAAPKRPLLNSDFAYWCAVTNVGNQVGRPREIALQQWQACAAEETTPNWDEFWKTSTTPSGRKTSAKTSATPSGSIEERIFYGGPFTGEKTQINRAWKLFNAVAIALAVATVAALRLDFSGAGATLMLALIGFVAYAQSSFKLGGLKRLTVWWICVTALTFFGAIAFRWLNTLS